MRAAGTCPGSVSASSTSILQSAAYQRPLSASTDVLQQEQMCPSHWNGFVQSSDGSSGNQSPQDYFIFLLFLASLTVAFKSKVLFAKLAGGNALMLDQQGDTSERDG